MLREFTKTGRWFLIFSVAALLAICSANIARATLVGAASFGDEMAGGRVSVTYSTGAVRVAPIVAGGGATGVATDPGFFDFSVAGDTFLADWRLTNTSNSDIILVEIDLSSTTSPGSMADPGPHTPGILFDDGTLPDTASGFAGRAGAVQVNVGSPLFSTALN